MELKTILSKLNLHSPSVLGRDRISKYAVMLPLIKREDGIHVLFEVRSFELRRQPGEICFPGGRIDPKDVDEKDAAMRETCEELGIKKENILEVFPLDFMISPFGMMVYPFAGLIKVSKPINPNPSEVSEVFTVPLTFLLQNPPAIYHINFKVVPEENFPFELIAGGENYNWRTRAADEHFYNYEGRIIWGLTARILSHFLDIIKND
jgi:coenzyme A diphosphatase NUDT7